jgi:integrase
MRGVTREHLRGFVAKLDAMVDEGKLSGSTANNIWRTCTCALGDAVTSKVQSVAVLEANPALNIEPPKDGDMKEKQFLYPDEYLKLVACAEVPLFYARLYTFAIYTGLRQGEVLGCEWRDVDLTHGTIHVHHQVDYVRGEGKDKPTKTRRSRRIKVEDHVRPMLEAMREESGGKGRVFPDPPPVTGEYGLANVIRRHVELAGADADRPELTKPADETQRALVFHDTRATHSVWRLKRNWPGDAPSDVKEDCGWGSIGTLDVYSRLARHMTGEPFPPLPARLVGGSKGPKTNSPSKAPRGYSTPKPTGNSVGATGFEFETGVLAIDERRREFGSQVTDNSRESRCRFVPRCAPSVPLGWQSYGN